MYKLTIEGLHKSYGEHQVLKGVSLKARTGDVISLIGASGSGNGGPSSRLRPEKPRETIPMRPSSLLRALVCKAEPWRRLTLPELRNTLAGYLKR